MRSAAVKALGTCGGSAAVKAHRAEVEALLGDYAVSEHLYVRGQLRDVRRVRDEAALVLAAYGR